MAPKADSDAQFIIRQLTEDDVALYHELRLEGLKNYPASFASSYEEEVELPASWSEERAKSTVIVGGFNENALMGVAGIYFRTETKLAHKGVLFGMYVTPDAHGSGLARKLVENVIEQARSRIEEVLLTVAASNIAAVKLYKNFGFVEYGMEPNSLKIGDEYHDQLLMRLGLHP